MNTNSTWRLPVRLEDIPEAGKHVELAPDAATREAVARAAGVEAVIALRAVFEVNRRGDGLRVEGAVTARVRQACVVTLEPFESDIKESVDLVFQPAPEGVEPGEAGAVTLRDGTPEPLIGGAVDLAEIATEFLILGVDPYPRKPGAIFAPPAARDAAAHPFAALAALKKIKPKQ